MITIDLNDKIALFKSLFNGRRDIYARYWKNLRTGKAGYRPLVIVDDINQTYDQIIGKHLVGEELIGIYPLLLNNTTHLLALDFDESDWMEEAYKVKDIAYQAGFASYLEKSKSGNGCHLWFFFSESVCSRQARQFGKLILSKAGQQNSYDRMFPSQDVHNGKHYGNLICLPLSGQYAPKNTTCFLDDQGNIIADQWLLLKDVSRIKPSSLAMYLEQEIVTTTSLKQIITNTHTDKQPAELTITLSSQIAFPGIQYYCDLKKFCQDKLKFFNPKYFELERFGYSTWKTPKFINCIEKKNSHIYLPLGFLPQLEIFCQQQNLSLTINKNYSSFKKIKFVSHLKLTDEQQDVLLQILKKDRCILHAQPGFGKTMVAIATLIKRAQPTIIIVHTKELLNQWKKRLSDYIVLEKGDLGIIGNNKWQLGTKITIASYATLIRRDLSSLNDKFGFLIVDECHHLPANTFLEVIKNLQIYNCLGLTATPYRKDKLEKLMSYYLSDQIVKAQTTLQKATNSVETKLIIRKTKFTTPCSMSNFSEIGEVLINDVSRNKLIIDDTVMALSKGEKCLILTERLEHCELLLSVLRENIKNIHGSIINGTMTQKARARVSQRLKQERFQFLIATGKLIGEGFDWPAVKNLFLVYPFSWKGKLIQYIGRIQREHHNKTVACVYDYLDDEVPALKAMYFKRLRTYRELGMIKSASKSACVEQVGLFD